MFVCLWTSLAAAGGWGQLGLGYAPVGSHLIEATLEGQAAEVRVSSRAGALDLGGGLTAGRGLVRVELGLEARLQALHADEVTGAVEDAHSALTEEDLPVRWAPRPTLGPSLGLVVGRTHQLGLRGLFLLGPTGWFGVSRGVAAEAWAGLGGAAQVAPYLRAQLLDHSYQESGLSVQARSMTMSMGLRFRLGARARASPPAATGHRAARNAS